MSDYTPTKPTRVRMNPARSTCEEIIRRILTTEEKENGTNRHFKNATDFMAYFESLYPSGPALTKQVQRAIKSLDLAKDENGYFMIHKTKEEQNRERELADALAKTHAALVPSLSLETVLLRTEPPYRAYLLAVLSETRSLSDRYVTIVETIDGLLFLTEDRDALLAALMPLLPDDASPTGASPTSSGGV